MKKAFTSKITVDINIIIKAFAKIFSLSYFKTNLALIFAQMTKPKAFAPKSKANFAHSSQKLRKTKLDPVI